MRHVLTCLLLILAATPAWAENVFTLVDKGDFSAAAQTAQATKDPLLEAYVAWAALRDPKTPTPVNFNDAYSFLSKHPGWPDEKTIRLRVEEAALDTTPDANTLQRFCTALPPISGRGMFACARGGAGTPQQRADWIKQGWEQGDFSEFEEGLILGQYGNQFSTADHVRRMERLLFEQKVSSARRMLPLVPRERETLYLAEMALLTNARDASSRLRSVPVNLQREPGLIYARMLWRDKHDDDQGVRDLLINGPANPPYADLWWKYRNSAVRDALADRHYEQAVRMLAERGEMKGEALADALFLKGWIALAFLKDTHGAYRDFFKLYGAVTTPVSKARAAYWAAEAARLNGNNDIMRQWLEKAAARPLTFYGQLAYLRLHPGKPLPLPTLPVIPKPEEAAFVANEQVRLIRALSAAQELEMMGRFFTNLAQRAEIPAQFVLLARLARQIGDEADAVHVAKQALRRGIGLIEIGWPLHAVPDDVAIEPALALSIIRQESEFDTQAASPAGARGLMQLLPATAREIARRHDINFDKHDLFHPEANITLGTHYLGELIDNANGSYILGIAAYNGGPGNVRKWRQDFGDPGSTPEDAVHWIENIPFSETRNYVMRVLENLQIYRQRIAPKAPLQLAHDLTRGYSPPTQPGPTVIP